MWTRWLHAGHLGLPQLTLMSLAAQLPRETPLNITVRQQRAKPGVVLRTR